MHGSGPIGAVLETLGRLDMGAERSGWLVTVASCLAVIAVGGIAARVARRLQRSSTPELIVLLDRSAAFYSRWPEHRLADAPAADVAAEAARCRRIVELLRATGNDPDRSGAIDGLRAWITLLGNVIDASADTRSGPAYA